MSLLINHDLIEKEISLNGKLKQYQKAIESIHDIAVLMEKCYDNTGETRIQKELSHALADFEHIRIDQIRILFELKSIIYTGEEFDVIKEYTERMEKE